MDATPADDGAPGRDDARRGAARSRADDREDLVAMLVATGALAVAAAFGAALQTSWVYAVVDTAPGPAATAARLVANLAGVTAGLTALTALRVHLTRRPGERVVRVACAGVLAALGRLVALAALDVSTSSWLVELLGAMPVVWAAGAVGLFVVDVQRRLRVRGAEVRRRTQQAAQAVAALAEEELRVRRAVAEGLHGTAQQRLTLAVHQLGRVVAAPDRQVDTTWRAVVAAVRDDLDDMREVEIRALSHLLYPAHLDLGVVPAVRAVVRVVPGPTVTLLAVDDAVRALDDPTALATSDAERLLAVRVVEEAVTNALRHGPPPTLTVRLTTEGGALVVEVQDDGEGFDPATTTLSGLARLADRVDLHGGGLQVASVPGEGVCVRAVVPLAHAGGNSQLR